MSMERLKYNRTVGLCSMEGRGFYYPTDTSIGDNGTLYTVSRSIDGDTRGIRVTTYNIEEEYFGTFARNGEEPGELIWPTAITHTKDGNVIVADEYMNRITEFDPEGNFVKILWVSESSDPGLDGPSGLAVDSDENVYVSDNNNHRIQVLDRSGGLQCSFGERGAEAGQLQHPWGLTVAPDGDVYIADWHNDRIQRFGVDGTFVRSYGEPGRRSDQLYKPASVCVDNDGYLYIADWGNEMVKVMDPEGNVVQSLRGEATESKWARAFLDINLEEAAAREKSDLETEVGYFVNDPHEVSSHIEKYFWAPMSVKLDDGDRLYVTESNRHRVQIYDLNR